MLTPAVPTHLVDRVGLDVGLDRPHAIVQEHPVEVESSCPVVRRVVQRGERLLPEGARQEIADAGDGHAGAARFNSRSPAGCGVKEQVLLDGTWAAKASDGGKVVRVSTRFRYPLTMCGGLTMLGGFRYLRRSHIHMCLIMPSYLCFTVVFADCLSCLSIIV